MINFRLNSDEFYFRIGIDWPKWLPWLHNTWSWYKDWLCTKHSAFELQVECDWSYLFEFEFQVNRRTDHSGFRFSLGILRHWIALSWYDTRHWNDDKNRYYNEEDYDSWYYTMDDANAKITELAHKIKNGIKDEELNKIVKDLPHNSWAMAIVGKLAEWQYATEAKRLADCIWQDETTDAWWIKQTGPMKKP